MKIEFQQRIEMHIKKKKTNGYPTTGKSRI